MGIAVDSSGYVYVADQWLNGYVEKFTSYGDYVNQWGGEGVFNYLSGIAVDSSGYVYTTDENRVQKFTSDGVPVTQWSTFGSNGQLVFPSAITVNGSGFVYVTIPSELNNIQIFTSDGGYVGNWSTHISLDPYSYIACNSSGIVYITIEGEVRMYSPSGGYINKWKGEANEGLPFWPMGIGVDSSGFVYVVDNGGYCVQKFTSDGVPVPQPPLRLSAVEFVLPSVIVAFVAAALLAIAHQTKHWPFRRKTPN